MPRFDRTGPMGRGPRTGGGFGFCGPYSYPVVGPVVYGVGRGGIPYGGGRGRCFGGGRGEWRMAASGYPPVWPGAVPPPAGTVAPEDELGYLRQEEASLREALNAIRRRVEELEGESKVP